MNDGWCGSAIRFFANQLTSQSKTIILDMSTEMEE